MKLDLEQGDYTVSAGDTSARDDASSIVGPERKSSQNDLLLP